MNWKLDDVPIFRAVVQCGGITAAADMLHMPKSSVSTALRRLEQDLGLQLIDRNTRTMRVTAEGEAFFQKCQAIMEQVEEADALMTGLTVTPTGRLSVALPGAFCQEILAPRLPEFRRRYPKIELDLVVTGQPVDILGDQFDLAIVVGAQPDSELTLKTLSKGRLIWVTSREYAVQHRFGEGLEDLLKHVSVCERRYALPQVKLRVSGAPTVVDLRRDMIRVNDPVSVRTAVLRGAGISFVPERYCIAHLGRGELVEVFPHIRFEMGAATLSAVYPTRRLMSARLRVFLDFLESFAASPAMPR